MQTFELAQKQQLLILQSARLRMEFQDRVQIIVRPLAVVDKVQSGLHWLQENPQWPLAGLILIAVMRPRSTLTWGARVAWVWRTCRYFYALNSGKPYTSH